jgi:1A family penicillin-binding protein
MSREFISIVNHKPTVKKNYWRLFWRICLFSSILGALFVAGVFLYFSKDLPDAGNVSNRFVVESTKIYDRTGNHLLYDIHGEEKRTQIDFKEIPETVKYATISLEDQGFYSHYGIDPKSIARAIIKDVLHRGVAQGASTITQQFVKNSILTNEKTFTRKIKEVILSLELERKYSKDEILGMYLNEIPYGSNAYGIEAAAQTFFGKHASELTLDEAALLASLPKAPSHYSPYGNYTPELKARQEYALTQMMNAGYITEEQAKEAKAVDILEKIRPTTENISAPHFVMYVKDYLEKKYGDQAIEKDGLKVYTTLDWDKQQIGEKVVKEGAENNLKKYKAENASLVAIDPKTGQILTMVGSKDYFDKTIDGQVNIAIRDLQPGSSFKPYVYLTAFMKGYTPETQLWDVDTNFSTDDGKEYNPKNYDGKNKGLLQMKNALAMSLNVPAVKTLYLVGVKDAINTAKSLGISTLNQPDRYGLSLVLGGGEVKLLDHVSAFGTLATGGIRHEKTAILKIVKSDGTILEEYKNDPGQKTIEEKYIAMLDHVMTTNEYRAPVFGENNPLKFTDRPVAAKTGTTNEWRDGWTMGYTPSLAVGVWAGNNDHSIMAEGADGIYVAAPIWRSFMDQVLKNYSVEQFPKYEKEETGKPILDGTIDMVEKLKVCEIPGKKDKYCLANDACSNSKADTKKFFNGHDILYYVKKDDPRGDVPKKPEEDPQFKNWEKAVANWAKDQKDLKNDPAPTEECNASDFKSSKPSVSVDSPSDGDTITSSEFSIKVSASAENGIKKVTISVNGKEVTSQDSSSVSYKYSIPSDKYTSTLTIEATVEDNDGNSSSDNIDVKANIPTTP